LKDIEKEKMKPVIIIAIAVVCSVVTVLGILGTISYIEDMENQLFRNDLLLAADIQTQYDIIMSNTCLPDPTISFSDGTSATQSLAKIESQVQYISEKQSELDDLRYNMELLQKKYPEGDFTLTEYPCPYNEEWISLIALTEKQSQESQTPESMNTIELSDPKTMETKQELTLTEIKNAYSDCKKDEKYGSSCKEMLKDMMSEYCHMNNKSPSEYDNCFGEITKIM